MTWRLKAGAGVCCASFAAAAGSTALLLQQQLCSTLAEKHAETDSVRGGDSARQRLQKGWASLA
jgi:hypothetical protein